MLFAIRRRRRAGNRSGRRRGPTRGASFASLVQKGQFDEIVAVLRGGGGDDNMDVTAWLLNESGHRRFGATTPFQNFQPQQLLPLHLVLQHRPPVELVRLLVGRLAALEEDAGGGRGRTGGVIDSDTVDVMGRSPLHVAVSHNCDLAVIEWLLRKMKMSPNTNLLPCDIWGRTPLHWAVLFGDKDGARPSATKHSRPPAQEAAALLEYRAKVVAAITGAFPDSVRVRDSEGCTAWELAARHHHPADGGALLRHLLLGGRANNKNNYREITVCNNNNRSNSSKNASSSGKQQHRQQHHHHHQYSGTTPDTSLMGSLADLSFADPDVPVEIVEVTKRERNTRVGDDDDADADACSSLGTGGISSKFRHRRRAAPRASRSTRNNNITASAKPKPTATWLYERAKF